MNITSHGVRILLRHVQDNKIESPDVDSLITELGLEAPNDKQLCATIMDILKEEKNSSMIEDYKNGNIKAVEPLMNQVMQIHRGADPKWSHELVVAGIQYYDGKT